MVQPGNYKGFWQDHFSVGGLIIEKQENDTLLYLQWIQTGTTGTLIDIRDNTSYQIPTARQARVLMILSAVGTTAVGDKLFHGDTVDSTSDATTICEPVSTLSNLTFLSAWIPANRFINKTGDGVAETWVIFMQERDA